MVLIGPGFRPKLGGNVASRAEDLAGFAVSYREPGERFQERGRWQLVGDRVVWKEMSICVSEVN